MKTYLCIEAGDKFVIEAENIEQAREDAITWNAEVIKEIKPEDIEKECTA